MIIDGGVDVLSPLQPPIDSRAWFVARDPPLGFPIRSQSQV
jgi:hypothetical protein